MLHSLTGPLAVASHHSLNYQISKETARGRDAIATEHYHLFSGLNTAPLLHAKDIFTKTKWLESVDLARAEYEAPDTSVIRQAMAQRTLMHNFLITNGPFVAHPLHALSQAYQDNKITLEEQQLASVNFFGNSISFVATRNTHSVSHTDPFQQAPIRAFF